MSTPPRERLALGVLARLPLFEGVSRPHFSEVIRHARTLHYQRAQVVAKRGEMVPGLFAVAYGMVKLTLHGATGAEKVLQLVGPSQTFGEIALFRQQPLPLDAVAVVDTGLVLVPAATLLALIDRDAHFARGMVASLCQRIHAMVSDFEATSLHGASGRLAAYLESLAETPDTVRVTLPAAKKLIAARLGMTKETFSRALRELAREGLVRVTGRSIELLDRARLARRD
ncbi:MAG TPA: Crp/Fnr family transcriptional regulator [Burkholderiales bacterium]|nr:Crp/Fnr family transcriptional regulator [Burkholderiales bacterium]